MEKSLRKVLVTLFLIAAGGSAFAGGNGTKNSKFNWNPVMDAIIQVESKGNPKAVSDKLSDRFNVAKSKEMFILIQSYHNPKNSVEKAIRSWNGGPRYSVRGTQKYYNKVMKLLK